MPGDIFSVGVDLGGTWIRLEAVDATGRRVRSLKYPAPTLAELPSFLKKRFRAWNVRSKLLFVASRGVWTPSERQQLKESLHSLAHTVTVMSDVEAAWHSAFGWEGAGVIVIAGTGSIAYGRNAKGRSDRAGGWGPLLGDEGSAFWIGKTWIKKTREADSSADILRLVRHPHGAVRRIAALTPRILSQAQRGNSVAKSIVQEAQDHLAELVVHLAKRLHFSRVIPVSWGGTLLSNPTFRAGFTRAVRRRCPGVRWVEPGALPAVAIARLF